jgi:hypothetical protein
MTEPQGVDPADVTGQQAIEQMTCEISGGSVRLYKTSGDLSTTAELHLCADGTVRLYHFESYRGMPPVVSERFGNPWTVVDARIQGGGVYKAALVRTTFTVLNGLTSGQQPIDEPFETTIEFANGSWHWAGQAVATGQASCHPTL